MLFSSLCGLIDVFVHVLFTWFRVQKIFTSVYKEEIQFSNMLARS